MDDNTGLTQAEFDDVRLYSIPATASVAAPSISLSWAGVSTSGTWRIERSQSPRGPFVAIAEGKDSKTEYVDRDESLKPQATYYYRVILTGDNATRSAPVGVITLTPRAAR
jgi:hypothetical protein